MKKPFAADGAAIVPRSPAEFARFFEEELTKWGQVVKKISIKPE